jgi:2,3-bisphosphoglycerate-independent phosphoglycerate mutase
MPMKKQVVLVILDGWGIGPKNDSNPIYTQGTPNLDYIKANFLIGSLKTSGLSIDLPFGIEGNIEGHETLGAGRIIYQNYPRITISIRDGSFANNPVFIEAFAHTKKYNSALNLAGLLTEGTIHASLYHLLSLIKLAKQNGVSQINLHLFTDGKDSDPKAALRLIGSLMYEFGGDEKIKIGSIAGRHFALDREQHWNRTQQTIEAMLGNGPTVENLEKFIRKNYENNVTDLYLEPRTIDPRFALKDNDALIFFNFREDSMRQLAAPFAAPDFSSFPIKKLNNLYVATMTEYSSAFRVPIAYPPVEIPNTLGKVLADNGKFQVHIAETEKYAHVTYFFNGFRQEPYKNEFRILVPSPSTLNYSDKPEMQAEEVTTRTIQAIEDGAFDFILVNYPNGDMVAHTGNFEAAKKAVKTIDDQMGRLLKEALNRTNVTLLITSDHGNMEIMKSPETGEITTTHDPSPVPIYIVGNDHKRSKPQTEVEVAEQQEIGVLSDVAPTILEILELPKPSEMTGQSLLKILK